jgi:imidazolonepropionase-like amidohydrolase
MAPDEAIAAASSAARAYLARPGLVIGRPADVVTYDNDPRDDIDELRRPAAVVRNGRRIR